MPYCSISTTPSLPLFGQQTQKIQNHESWILTTLSSTRSMVLTTLVHLTVGLGLPVPLQYILTSCPLSASNWDLLLEWMEGGALHVTNAVKLN
jgi:hypothetical protein